MPTGFDTNSFPDVIVESKPGLIVKYITSVGAVPKTYVPLLALNALVL